MTERLGVCPYCGAARTRPGQSFCPACGRVTTGDTDSAGADGDSTRAVSAPEPGGTGAGVPARGPANVDGRTIEPAPPPLSPSLAPGGQPPADPPPTPSAPPMHGAVLADWREFRSILRVATYVLAGWAFLAVVAGATFGFAVARDVGSEYSANFGVVDFDPIVVLSRIAMFSSLVAGLGLRTFSVEAPITFALVPFGGLAVLAILARFAAATALRRHPPSSIADMFVRITLAAGIAALAVFALASLAILAIADNSYPPIDQLVAAPTGTPLGAAPLGEAAVFTLFPVLWIATALGVFSLPPARVLVARAVSVRAGRSGDRAVELLGIVWSGVAAYIRALLALGLVLFGGWIVWLLANGADAWATLLAAPTAFLMAPNGVLGLALTATGSIASYPTGTLALWQHDGYLVGAGVVALALPPFVAGLTIERRYRDADPGRVLLAGLAVAAVALLLVNVAAPSVGALGATQKLEVTRLTFDLGPVVLVGGVFVVALVVLGFAAGMPLHARAARQVLAPAVDSPAE